MPGIVEFPLLVQRAVEGFGDLFYGEPQRKHFAEYLTGLLIADRKTVSGINREFARTTDQSCLNRFLTEVDWDVETLNERRLDFFQRDPATRYSERGVIDFVCARDIPGDFTWDSYFSNAEIMNHTHAKRDKYDRPRGYIGDLKTNRKLEWKGGIQRVDRLAADIDPADKKELRRGDRRQWYFTVTCHIPKVNHKVRIVIIWDHRRDTQPKKVLVTNRVRWEVVRILKVYRYRWTGTETFHRDGKQELGMGDCQLRSGEGQTRHMYLVMLAYSLLMSQLQQGRAQEWALCKLTTIGEACRAMLRESLRNTIRWAIDQATKKSRDYDHIIAQLAIS